MNSRMSLILLSFIFSSCSMLFPERRHQEYMDQEEGFAFVPLRDYRVIPGDTGDPYRTSEELADRVPPTKYENIENFRQQALSNELAELLEQQSEYALKQYMKYQDRMPSHSHRIYFLRLSTVQERIDYLRGLGFFVERDTIYSGPERRRAIRDRDVLLGMSKSEVIAGMGRPWSVDIAGDPAEQNERWSYREDGQTKYIYFESGRVEGWQTKQ